MLDLGEVKFTCQLGEHVGLHGASGEKMQLDAQEEIEKVFYRVTWGAQRVGTGSEETFLKLLESWAA